MVESNCEFAMQAPQEILVPRRSLFEPDYDMIVISKESPRLQDELVVFSQFESCIAEKV